MQSPDPAGQPQPQPRTGCPFLPAPGACFQGFRPPTGHPAQFFNEIWDVRCNGLNKDLRFALLALARETVGEAFQGGNPTCDFVAVPWARWADRLEVRSINTVKARMALLEEMGLVEVLPGGCGPRGGTAPRFRLRWAQEGDSGAEMPEAILEDREPNAGSRECHGVDAHPLDARQTDTRQTDTRQIDTPQIDPHHFDTRQPDTLLSNQNAFTSTNNSSQSINPSILEVNELIEKMTIELNSINPNQNQSNQPRRIEATDRAGEGRRPGFNVSPWLRGESQDPWPEPLCQGLGEILDPERIPGLAKRSPWTGEGAWAILQALRAKGRKLGNPGGTLWNALLQAEKGALWLTHAGPILRQAGWRMEPEDGTPMAAGPRAEGGLRLARMGYSRLPLQGAALERQKRLLEDVLRRENTVDLDPTEYLDDDDDPTPSVEEPMIQQTEPETVKYAEDLSPEVKARLRTLIETYREASLAARRSPAINRPGFFDACSEAWQGITAVLEPELPLEVKLTDDPFPTTIRRRAQIKTILLYPLYLAVS